VQATVLLMTFGGMAKFITGPLKPKKGWGQWLACPPNQQKGEDSERRAQCRISVFWGPDFRFGKKKVIL